MVSYSSAAASTGPAPGRTQRRRAVPGGAGASNSLSSHHSRQHSANTAGDVFAMLGGGLPSSRDREKVAVAPDDGGSKADASNGSSLNAHEGSRLSSPDSDSPSTPSSSAFHEGSAGGRPSPARYRALYDKHTLLKLWNAQRTTRVDLQGLHAAYEPPELQQTSVTEQRFQHGRHQDNLQSGSERAHGLAYRRLHASDQPAAPATSGRRSDRYGSVGIQGGVLPGVQTGRKLSGSNRDDDLFETDRPGIGLPRSARQASYGANVREDREKGNSGPAASGPAWTANRWRHLQQDEDTHISSNSTSGSNSGRQSREGERGPDVGELWDHDADWRPSQSDRIAEERPLHSQRKNTSDSLAASTSTGRLWTDDLLSPAVGSAASRLTNPSTFPSEPHPIATAVASAPSRSPATIRDTLALLSIGAENTGRSSPLRRLSGSANGREGQSPARAQASEGLDILARRSPVQEVSMQHLQQQSLLQAQREQQQAILAQEAASANWAAQNRLAHNPDTMFWQYRDPQGLIQGPFSASQMQEWYQQGFFTDTLHVKRVESDNFETLGALVIRLQDATRPFISAPVQKLFAPPGIGLGQPPISHSPLPFRTASPALWQNSQASSRSTSFSTHTHFPDHFASSTPSVPAFGTPMVAPQPPAASIPIDPWADTLPPSPVISRSTSLRGLQDTQLPDAPKAPKPIATPVGAPPQRPIPTTQKSLDVGSSASALVPSSTPTQRELGQNDASAAVGDRTARQAANSKAERNTAIEQDVKTGASSKQTNSTRSAHDMPAAEIDVVLSGKSKLPDPAIEIAAPGRTQIASKDFDLQQPPALLAPAQTQIAESSKGKVHVISQEQFEQQKKRVSTTSSKSIEVPLASATSPPVSTSTPKAAPWAKPADAATIAKTSIPASTSSSLSLREIQEKEKKESEARKAAEKRAQAARLAAEEAAAAERAAKEAAEVLPSSSTWASSAPVPSSAASAPAVSPWAKPVTPAASAPTKKKTLKEIQDEEEARRKKVAAAQAAQTAGVVSGKGYAGSLGGSKPASLASSVAATSGPGWTTVGAKAPIVMAAPSPPSKANGVATPKAPAPASVSSIANKLGSSTSSSSSVAKAGVSGLSANGKSDEGHTPASPELLSWCKTALKGLKDVNIDDFLNMLLSFPVPIDKSTRELISDSVYASSTTLDGRYFADAFADKRIADVKAIKAGKAAPAPPQPKPASFTDAIKFVPNKPQEPNFKIVTKKQGKKK